ncbi:CDP-alcohol phosphatidyltransferase family protein [Actinocorallia sp. A-T 12471]|uniref:CDP-alcohol phosphatidyltransferase family protein n=1 Tax=Actinocorallia sp. A-T 12471 TaxID=3089813 RepID=UPI0029D2CE07|nr:CDP-alcohol phosphatidyltransferase family protein [Actinocorallia sp. A-T 12471]MDX6738506.1 CDP-alcohol phosphatidyltransferase family protein [Actinocorallia sp. A-T 12471]
MSVFRTALRDLAGAQKTAKGAPAYSRFVNRPLGRVFAAAAFTLGRTPNQVTAVSGLFSFAGIAIIALVEPSWPSAVAVSLCLVLGYALDAADGQLARLRGGGSKSGEWLDHMIDAAKISSLHAAVLVCYFRFVQPEQDWRLLVPLGWGIVAAVMFFAMILNDQLRRAAGTAPTASAAASPLRALLVIPTDYGLLCVAFLLLGAPVVFEAVYGALFAGNALFLAAALVKWYREIAALDRAAVERVAA